MNTKVLAVGLLLTVPLVVVLALSFGNNPHFVESPLVGREAPPFELQDLDGNVVGIESILQDGRPVVLNFWATWCSPCKLEHPVLLRASQLYGDQVAFYGVVYQDEREAIDAYLQRYGSGYPTLEDLGGKVAIRYGVYGVPETFFVSRDGQIVHKHTGPIGWDQMSSALGRLL